MKLSESGSRKIQLHPGREKENTVISGERERKSSYIRGERKKILLHPEREKENAVISGKRERKNSYIRGERMRLYLRKEDGIMGRLGRFCAFS